MLASGSSGKFENLRFSKKPNYEKSVEYPVALHRGLFISYKNKTNNLQNPDTIQNVKIYLKKACFIRTVFV